MNPQAQAQFDTLGKIKDKLIDIRDNRPEARAAIENTELGGALGNVFKDLQVEKGVLTSRSAKQAVDNASKNLTTRTGKTTANDPFQELRDSYQRVTKQLEQEKATREGLEADLSIKDKQAQRELEAAQSGGTTGETKTGASINMDGSTDVPAADDTAVFAGEQSADPIVQANIVRMQEQTKLINQQIDALDAYVDASEEDSKAMVASIRKSAETQTARAERENARLAQAARVAGIVAGRGMYSPEEHEGIISETIQEGLDRITDIENTRDTLILEAKKAQREFAYKAFVEMSDMVNDLSDLKQQTIIDVNTRLNEIEAQAKEQMKFDQEQADRNAFILAPELMNATPEEIYKAALANGVEPGLLAREVQTYKDDQRMTELDIQGKEENIKTQQYNRYLSSLKASGSDKAAEELKPMNKTEQEQFKESYGWNPPFGMSFEEALRIDETFANEPAGVKLARAKEIMVGANKDFVTLAAEDIKTLADADEGVADSLKQIGKELGVTNFFGRSRGNDEILVDAKMESYVQQAVAEAEIAGVSLTTREIVDTIARMVAQDKERENTKKRSTEKEARTSSQTNAQSTAPVIIR